MALRTANVNIRIEPAVKMQAAEIFTGSGLSFSDAVNAFCKETIKRNAIPFRFSARKEHPLDMSKMTDEEVAKKFERGAHSSAFPAKAAFAEIQEATST